MIFWFIQNHSLALGYDHGAYSHFVNLLSQGQKIDQLPVYLQHQFEPFSGTFFYVLTEFIGKDVFFSWWYLAIYIGISCTLFLLGKKNNKYTLGSYLWLFFFLFSVLQYTNFWWSFWKQMFATFFLIILMRYHRNIIIAILLSAACVWLHRLTGFVAILYLIFSLASLWKKRNIKVISMTILGIFFGIVSYKSTFSYQVMSFLRSITQHFTDYIWIKGEYGTGFGGIHFWFYQTPLLLMTLLWIVTYGMYENIGNIIKKPHIILCIIIGLMVIFRCIAYTRLWSFLDLFLIILIVKTFYHTIQKKWIYIFMVIQVAIWWIFAYKWHTPFIDKEEYEIIRNITKNIPENVTMVTLSAGYMSWMTGYMDNEIYSLSQWISSNIWSWTDKENMQFDKRLLCRKLSTLPGDIFIYVGVKEKFTSTQNNECLSEVKKWRNNARLLLYAWSR